MLLVDEDQVREHLSKLVICKSLGPNMMHPQVLRELGDVMTSFVMKCKDIPDYLRTIWQLGEMPGDWWKENVSPVFKKDKGDPGNYRLFSITSVLGKVMEQLMLEMLFRDREKKTTGSSQYGFTKGKSYLTNLITFSNKLNRLAGERTLPTCLGSILTLYPIGSSYGN